MFLFNERINNFNVSANVYRFNIIQSSLKCESYFVQLIVVQTKFGIQRLAVVSFYRYQEAMAKSAQCNTEYVGVGQSEASAPTGTPNSGESKECGDAVRAHQDWRTLARRRVRWTYRQRHCSPILKFSLFNRIDSSARIFRLAFQFLRGQNSFSDTQGGQGFPNDLE